MRIANRIIPMVIAGSVLMIGLTAGYAGQDIRLPGEPVMRAIERLLPGGKVEQIELERRIIQFYDITVQVDGRVVEITVMEDGTVLNLEEEVKRSHLPDAVSQALAELARDGRLTEVERVEHHGELKVVALDEPRIEYEAEIRIDGRERLIRLSENGESTQGARVRGADDEDSEADDD